MFDRPARFCGLLAFVNWIPSVAAYGDPPKTVADSFEQLNQVAKEYKIKIAGSEWKFPVKTFHGKIDGRNPRRQALDAYVGLFAREFRLYPKSLVKRAKLKQIVLCEQLAFAGQRRNAIPDFEHDTLYLEVSRGSYSKPYMRRVIHHEFFHIVDYRDDGHVYRDKRWAN